MKNVLDKKESKNLNQGFDRYASDVLFDSALEEEAIAYGGFLKSRMMIIRSINKGLTFDFFREILRASPFTEDEWADYLGLSKRTLQRYDQAKGHIFKPIHSEKILELAQVSDLGSRVFDTTDQFKRWLHTPSLALGDNKPADLIRSSYGKDLVMDELNRIDQGIFA